MTFAEGVTPTATFESELDHRMRYIANSLRHMPVHRAAECTARYQNMLLGVEAEIFARNKADGASDRDNEKLAGRGRSSTKADAKKRAKRGAAVKENPDLANDVAEGELGADQLDAIAEAAAKTGGAAANALDLIDKIKSSAPDDARNIAKSWVSERNEANNETRRDKQRRQREVSRFTTRDDCSAILIKGDDESVDQIWAAVGTAAKKLWTKDGGRDVPKGKHPRTRKQRLFDAAFQALTKADSGSGCGSGVTAKVHMWVKLEDFLSGDYNATFADGRIVPDTVLSSYMCNGTIAATVFDKNGEVIHHGREHRYATPAQVRGLIARDKGCVLCHADPSECEAHHLIPWNAPGKGKTDIDHLALVCTDCHHYIHDTLQTLYRNAKGLWRLRPATFDEIPVTGPPRAEQRHRRPDKHKVRHE